MSPPNTPLAVPCCGGASSFAPRMDSDDHYPSWYWPQAATRPLVCHLDIAGCAWCSFQFYLKQGSLQYTPEHCLVNGGFLVFRWGKNMFQMGQRYLISPARSTEGAPSKPDTRSSQVQLGPRRPAARKLRFPEGGRAISPICCVCFCFLFLFCFLEGNPFLDC